MKFYKENPPPQLAEYDIEFFRQDTQQDLAVLAHVHAAIELIYVIEGHYQVEADGEGADLCPGDLVLFRSNAIHALTKTDPETGYYYVLKLTPSFLFQVFKGGNSAECVMPFLRGGEGSPFVFPSGRLSDEQHGILRKMIAEYTADGPMIYAMEKAYACVLVVSLFRTFFAEQALGQGSNSVLNGDNVALIHESVQYLNENYASDITAAECAEKVYLSYSYYSRLFHMVMGKSFREYLSNLRMAKAHNLLLATDVSVTDIALSCGYNSPAYFTAEYKRHYGTTPTKSRNQMKKGC